MPPSPKWLDVESFSNSQKKRRSNLEEKKVAAKLGGRRTPNSGARPVVQGCAETQGMDGSNRDFAWEHKRIEKSTKTMRVERKWLEDISVSAERVMKIPAVVVLFEGQRVGADEWIMLPLDVAIRLLGIQVK